MKLRAENLVKVYRGRRVVNGISLEVEQGEVVGLLGPNGAGKTTTFYMIVGLVRPQSGHVYLDNREITRLPMYRRAREGIAYLPQEPSVFRNLTVEENLLLVLEAQPLTKAQRRQRMEELLGQLNIGHLRRSLGRLLSGGERRRVEIARALAAKPKFILLDEPFTGVDPLAIEDIGNIVHDLAKSENRIGILITDHNVEAMLDITERAYIIADGVKRVEGPAHTLLQDPVAIRSYFGERYTYSRGHGAHQGLRARAEAELREAGIAPWEAPETETTPKEKEPDHEAH
ncbi:ABC-type (unclassified) transport system, ATPase component [Chthonomonas calidirosea]|uniref:ABC-type (Unclassified) transport system, ATPase component n=1 Tax=Chthonomonas calidirosea (strain DSM 23976 / ICMP 18418 / T49) TaxID=1303518 RepID=S0EYW7_CHTCT|nr:LPS export ABC transporter ATP-binding protein [Chthonomonas calidirosea]CCW35766.1 ABC-type (unclassified) transport system, ATPase component [Chthonomonas calidirosea T49]CEK18287.1 ABC-type (unclassified) transport system, ATPase component [Chthonomonas calidirosea]CEK18291.1 ABC-type (unclassified) transport system, ATPase component [Chthonomonas calidirosea]CEK19301.1 ABC-type (unclassified) transport system, ATPase component [Chthonomonas calidirosea]